MAPGDQTRMHSVLGGFFQSPVSGEEKKRRLTERLACTVLSPSLFSVCLIFLPSCVVHVVERAQRKVPERYLLTKEQMIENEYPLPSYIAETFEKSDGWFETPQPSDDAITSGKQPRIFAVDCEMVAYFTKLYLTYTESVHTV